MKIGYVDMDVLLIKTDSVGDTLWIRTYGDSLNDDRGNSVTQTFDGGYIVAGETFSTETSERYIYLLKTDSSGDSVWAKKYGWGGWDIGHSVEQTVDGGYIITGNVLSPLSGGQDIYLVKTDSLGDTLWTKTFGGIGGEGGHSVEQTSEGGYIIGGWTTSFGAGENDVYLIKTNPVFPFYLSFPADSSSIPIVRPTFIWKSSSSVNGIRDYEVFIDDTSRTTLQDTSWTVDYDLKEGYHKWYIVAYDSLNYHNESVEKWTLGIDLSAPLIESTTIWNDTSYAGPFTVYTEVIDMSYLDTVLLYYKRLEDSYWVSTEMFTNTKNLYHGEIPPISLPDDTVKYYIYTRDICYYESTDPPGAPSNYYSFIGSYSGIDDYSNPEKFSLEVKSPSKDKIIFKLSLPGKSKIKISLYDVTGRCVLESESKEYSEGFYEIPLKLDKRGIYFYKFVSSYGIRNGKLVVF